MNYGCCRLPQRTGPDPVAKCLNTISFNYRVKCQPAAAKLSAVNRNRLYILSLTTCDRAALARCSVSVSV